MVEIDDNDQGVVKAFRNALRKAWEDGRISYDERNIIAQFTDGLPISQETVSELEAREYLRYRWREYGSTPLDQQLALAEKALAIDRDNDFLWMKKGSIQFLMGNIDGALVSLERSLELDPLSEEAWFWKGISYTSHGDLDAALDCFERAVEQDPDQTLSWVMLSRLERKMGNLDKSRACANRAVESRPEHPIGLIERALTAQSKGNYDEAMDDIKKALLLDPDNGSAIKAQEAIEKAAKASVGPQAAPPSAKPEQRKEAKKRPLAKVGVTPDEQRPPQPTPPLKTEHKGPEEGLKPPVVEPEHEDISPPSQTPGKVPEAKESSETGKEAPRKASLLDDDMFDDSPRVNPPSPPTPPQETAQAKGPQVPEEEVMGEVDEEIEEENVEIVYKVIPCPKCGSGVPITTQERPVVVVCPSCGAKGRIMK